MTTSAENVATQLRRGFESGAGQEAMAALYADEVMLRHDPPLETDGSIDAAVLAAVSRAEMEAAQRALPDIAQSDIEVTVEGDRVDFSTVIRGTLETGKAVEVETRVRFTVADDRIVGMEGRLDADSRATWGEVLAAGGFTIPVANS